ncbi:hypothetical protein DS885_08575 [Psychromonas sp. B3M02]|uniref:hypothetical protein n=1 Tax=Psychromonas sp. B3M02 TaxID=2267226 RepID=UPI000DEAD360|nr:hypothetical protein [Psychromonas sp. B3M02]RBW46371.1 hypothetical protein DS885_08575 [Psychromonas sp. B3M02]
MNHNDTVTIDLTRTLLKDGPKFLSHKVIVDGDLAFLRPTITSMLFCVVYIVVGLFLIALASYQLIISDKYDLAIFVGGFGVAIGTFGIALIQPFVSRATFNRVTGVFNNHTDRNVKLHNIVSLQINNKMIQRKHAISYPCYELNLLTEHGRRINILNHNDLIQLMHDGNLLGNFLGVEVLDCRREIIL